MPRDLYISLKTTGLGKDGETWDMRRPGSARPCHLPEDLVQVSKLLRTGLSCLGYKVTEMDMSPLMSVTVTLINELELMVKKIKNRF